MIWEVEQIVDNMVAISVNKDIKKNLPAISRTLRELADVFEEVFDEIEKDMTKEKSIQNPEGFESRCIKKIRVVLNQNLKWLKED